MKKFLLLSAISLLFLVPKETLAWGHTGHSIIVEIAFKNLDEKTKSIVTKYLDGLSIQDAANWMDEQRSDPSFDYLKPLHYINIEKGKEYNNESNNIASELKRILSDFDKINTLTDEAIKIDLLEVMHLMGDIHQPLHVGYGDDKGGNTYQVQFNGKGSNLHKVWDSEIIEYKNIKGVFENFRIEGKLDDVIDVKSWIFGSRLLLRNIYPTNHIITNDYIDENAVVIQKQLVQAGIRLANVLKHYFKDFNRTPKFVHQPQEDEPLAVITINELEKNIGRMVRVCTKVYGTKQLSSGITFLNCGGDYPNSPLTIVIFKDDLKNFKNNPEKYYNGKEICITGFLKMYKDKPEIVAKKEEEILVK